MPDLRVRFAPSPTGSLHIGGVRTALFNYLLARSQGGQFLLRIEDTDRERSKPEFEREILDGLNWLGLHADGLIVRQSDHFDLYRSVAEELIQKGKARISLDKGGRAVVFLMPKTHVEFHDLVHGSIEFDTLSFEDLVLIKSDGSPAYNFACVVDDHAMRISHVIRGDDHVSNTPKQILLYEALDYDVPRFAHLPLIVGKDGMPLSKRHGAVSLEAYRRDGFLPLALLNYLVLLGWSPGTDQELFTFEELAREFKIEQVNSKSACFDHEKLRWMNGEHIRRLDPGPYVAALKAFLKIHAPEMEQPARERLEEAALLFRERIKTFKEFLEQADYFFKAELSYDPAAVKKYWQSDAVKERLRKICQALRQREFGDSVALEKSTRELASEMGTRAGDLIHPLRVALTGRSVSPGIFDLMAALGKERVLERLEYAVDHFEELRERLCSQTGTSGE